MDATTTSRNYLELFSKAAIGLAVICGLFGVSMLTTNIEFPPLTADTAAPFGWHLVITGSVLGFLGALPYLPPVGRWTRLALSLLGLGLAGIVAFPNLAIPFRILTELSAERAWLLLLAFPGLACASAYFLVSELLPRFKQEDDEPLELSEEPSDAQLVEALSVPHTGDVLTIGIRNSVYTIALMAFMTYGFAAAYLYKGSLEVLVFDRTFLGWQQLGTTAWEVAVDMSPFALVGFSVAPVFILIEWARRYQSLQMLRTRDDAGRLFGEQDKAIAEVGAKRFRDLIESNPSGPSWLIWLFLGLLFTPMSVAVAWISIFNDGFLGPIMEAQRTAQLKDYIYRDEMGLFEGIMFVLSFGYGAFLAFLPFKFSDDLAFKSYFIGSQDTADETLTKLFKALGVSIRTGEITSPEEADPKALMVSWATQWVPMVVRLCAIGTVLAALVLPFDRAQYLLVTPENITYSRYGSFKNQTVPLSEVTELRIECRNSKGGDLMLGWIIVLENGHRVDLVRNTEALRRLTDQEIGTLIEINARIRLSGTSVREVDTRADFERMVVEDHCEAGLLQLFSQEKAGTIRPLFRLTAS